MVLSQAGFGQLHVPKCFRLKGLVLHCGQRPSVQLQTGVQQDQGQWRGAVEEKQQVLAQVPGSAPAPWTAGSRDLQPPPWPLLSLQDQVLPGSAKHLLPHGFILKRKTYGVVPSPSKLPALFCAARSFPSFLCPSPSVAGPSEWRDHATL